MWNRILFLLFFGSALAVDLTTWKQGQEYQYLIRSRTLTALEKISKQYTGIIVKGLLTIQRKDEETLRARVSEPKYAQIHTELPGGWDSHIPDEKLELQDMPLSPTPFEIKLKHGVVRDLVVDKSTPTWELNVLKSIVSQLQVDTQGENAKWSKSYQVPEDDNSPYAMFRAMEDTVSGKCEVLYDIAPLPEEMLQVNPELVPLPSLDPDRRFIEVVKTKNYEKCDQRMGYHFGFTGQTMWEPGANDNGYFLTKSSSSRIVISGTLKSYTIQSSVSTNKMYVSPKLNDHQSGIVASCMNLTLARVYENPKSFGSPQNPESTGNLVYTYNDPFSKTGNVKSWKPTISQDSRGMSESSSSSSSDSGSVENLRYASDSYEADRSISHEDRVYWQPKPKLDEAPDNPLLPYFVGYRGKAVRLAENFNPVQEAQELINEISDELQKPDSIPEHYTLDKFTTLCSLIRTMSWKEIQEIEKSIPYEGSAKESSSKHISAWAAYRDAVAQAGTGPAFLMIKDWILKRKVKGVEAAGIFVHLPESVRTPTTEYMDEFFSLIKSPEVTEENFLNASAIMAFSNLIHESQINNRSLHNRYPVHSFGRMSPKHNENVFNKYIPYLGDKLKVAVKERDSPKIQMYSIALGKIGHPKILGIFEPYIEGKEPVTHFQRLVMVTSLGTLADLYPKVARPVFFKIYLNTMEHHEIRCAAVMLLMKTKPPLSMMLRMAEFTRHDTSKHVNSAVISTIRNVARLENDWYRNLAMNARIASNLLSKKHYDQRYSHLTMKNVMDPQWYSSYWLGVGYLGSDDSCWMRDLYVVLQRSAGGFRIPTSQMSFMMSSIKQFFLHLQMWEYDDARSLAEEVAKLLKIKPEHNDRFEGHVSFDNLAYAFDSSIFDKIARAFPSFTKTLTQGFEWDKKKFLNSEVILAFPTETGLPFLYTLKTPQINQFAGKFKLDGSLNSDIRAKVEGRMTSSKNVQGRIGFITPFDHQYYVAGVDMNDYYSLPGKVELDMNIPQKRAQMIFRARDDSTFRLVHYSVVPFTSKHDILNLKPIRLDENTHEVHTEKPTKLTFSYEPTSSFQLNTDWETDRTENFMPDYSDPLRNYVFPWSQNDGTYQKFETYGKSKVGDSEAATLTVVYDSVYGSQSSPQTVNKDQKPGFLKIPDKNPDSPSRRKAMMEAVAKGINSPKSYVVDVSLELGKTAKSLMTIAYSWSPVDDYQQSFVYFHHNYPEKSSEFELCSATQLRSPHTSYMDYEKVLKMDVSEEFNTIVRYGRDCQSGSEVDIGYKQSRTDQRRGYVETLPVAKKCKEEMKAGNKYLQACWDASYAATAHDAFDATVKFGPGNELVKGFVQTMLSIAKGMAFPYFAVNLVNTVNKDADKILVHGQMTPELRELSIGVHAPNVDTYFQNIKVYDKFLSGYDMKNSDGSTTRMVDYHSDNDYCVLDNNKVMTFDKKSYPAKLDKCSHVAMTTYPTQDPVNGRSVPIPEDMRVSVLVGESGDSKKELKIGFGQEEVLVLPSGQRPDVFVGGKKITYSKDQIYYNEKSGEIYPMFEVYELPNGYVRISSDKYDVDIIYEPQRVLIRASDDYHQAVRGLCGNYDFQPENDFITPKNCIMSKPEVFVASYALVDKKCEGPSVKYVKDIPKTLCTKQEYRHSNVISDREAGRWPTLEGKNWGYHSHEQKVPKDCNHYRTQVVEKDNQVCFTTRPVPACGKGCSADEMKPKKYDLYCLPNNEQAAAMRRRIEQGASPDLSHKPVSTTQYIDVPVTCSRGV